MPIKFDNEGWFSSLLGGCATANNSVSVTTASNMWSALSGEWPLPRKFPKATAATGAANEQYFGINYINSAIVQQQMVYNQWIRNISYVTTFSPIDWVETPEDRAKREAKRAAANQRAEHLMFSIISRRQRDDYETKQWFEIEVNGRIYRIHKGRAQNVYLIENGKPTVRYCAHPSELTPDADAMLAQMLMLKTDEQKFIKTANQLRLAA